MIKITRSRFLAVSAFTAFTLAGFAGYTHKIPTKSISAKERHPAAEIPIVAYGTGTEWYKPNEEQAKALVKSVEAAIQNGYYHIDCAEMYQNEEHVGAGIKNSGVARDKLFITSKVGQNHRRPEDIEIAVKDSIAKLNVKYLDLYLIHSPFDCPVPLKESWQAMEGLVTKGLVRNIGVSNFQVNHLQEILKSAKVPPVVNQIEFHPQLNQSELRKFCKDNKILIESYAPLIAFYGKPPNEKLIKEAEKIGKKYGKTAAQVLLRWNYQQGDLIVTTTSNTKRLKENQDIFDFKLTDTEVAQIDKIGNESPKRQYWQPYFPEDKGKAKL